MRDTSKNIKIFTGFSFILAGILYLIKKNYLLSSVLLAVGVYYLLSLRKNNNSKNKSNMNKVSYDLKIELRQLMLKRKLSAQIKAINRYRKVTGGSLKEAKEYTDGLRY